MSLKITELVATSSLASDDILPVVTSPTTLPLNKKITVENLFGYLKNGNICEGRLTLASGNPVPTSDITGASATTLYFTPYNGNRISTYFGGKWTVSTFSELSLSLSGLLINTNYDIYVYLNSGVPTLIAYAWSNSDAGAGTRTHLLVLQDGVWVRNGGTHIRYLGTIRTTAVAGQSEDSASKRLCWNYYNQQWREFNKTITGSHSYELTTPWRAWNNDATARLEMVCGQTNEVDVIVESTQKVQGNVSAMLNATNAGSFMGSIANENTGYVRCAIERRTNVTTGYNFIQAVELGGTGAVQAIVTLRGGTYG
jgi:hypothetical protein